MKKTLIIAILAFAYMFIHYALDDTQAMKTCEAHSSHDECFYALNH